MGSVLGVGTRLIQHPIVPGNGPQTARLLILGERPGANEMIEHAPMVGRTGEHVYRALGVRLPRDAAQGTMRKWQTGVLEQINTRITNVRCTIDPKVQPEDCVGHLQAELGMLAEARTVLCVGADAAGAVLGRTDITKLHGSVWTRAEADAMRAVSQGSLELPPQVHSVVCTFHPAYAMRGLPQAWGLIYRAIQKAKQWSQREAGPERDFRLNLNPMPRDLAEMFSGTALLGIDLETPRDDHTKIRMVGVAPDDRTALVFGWREPFIEIFKKGVRLPGIGKVGHNFAFDRKALAANGVNLAEPCYCTMQREALLRPSFRESSKRRWLALSTCAQHWLNDWPYHKESDDPLTQVAYSSMLPDVASYLYEEAYCGLDAIAARRLATAQEPELEKQGMTRLYSEVVAPAASVFVRMEATGVLIDEVLRKEMKKEAEERIVTLTENLEQATSEFHAKRQARLTGLITKLSEDLENELATFPLFGVERKGEAEPLVQCEDHRDYRGLTQRKKCVGCAKIYAGSANFRARICEKRQQITKAKGLLKRLGATFQNTDDAWRSLLFDKEIGYGLPVIATTTKRGDPKVNEETIEELSDLHPEIPVLAIRTEMQHLRRRLKIVLGIPVDEGGYAHFVFSLHRASTGRSSSGDDADEPDKYRESEAGNGQNWRDEDRRLIISEPGKIWASADFEQIDLRTMAWRAGDTKLIAALWGGADIHGQNAARMFGIPLSEVKTVKIWHKGRLEVARQAGKTVTHAVGFGAREKRIGREIRPWQGRPIEEVVAFLRLTENRDALFKALRLRFFARTLIALDKIAGTPSQHSRLYDAANTITAKSWIAAYFAEWPRMREYQDELVAKMAADGFITNAWGRRMRCYEWRYDSAGHRTPADANDVIAFPAQSDAGEVAKAVLPAIEQVFWECGGALRIFDHDAFDGDILPEMRDEFVKQGRVALEREWPEMGEIAGFGLFRCPAAFSFGANRGKFDAEKNPTGVKEWKP